MILFGLVFFLVVLAVSPAIVTGIPGKPSATCPLLTEPVTIDGKWTSTTEWNDAPETQIVALKRAVVVGYFRCKHDATYLYILAEFLTDTDTEYDQTSRRGDSMEVMIDTLHNGGNSTSPDDYYFFAMYVNASYTRHYAFQGNASAIHPKGWTIHELEFEAMINLDTENSPHPPHPHVTGEFKIPLSLIPGQVIGFYIQMNYMQQRSEEQLFRTQPVWPAEGWTEVPSSWGDVTISSSPLQSTTVVTTMHSFMSASEWTVPPGKLSVVCPMLTQPVTIDGKWTSTTEWEDASETPIFSAAGIVGYFRCKHDATDLYVLGESLVDTEAEYNQTAQSGDKMTVYLDTLHNGGNLPLPDDYSFQAEYHNASYTELWDSSLVGNGTPVWAPQGAILGMDAMINLDTENSPHLPHPHVTGEFKIPLSLIPGDVFGFYIHMEDSSGADQMSMDWPSPRAQATLGLAACPYIYDWPRCWADMWLSSTPLQSSTVVSTMQPTPTQVSTSSPVSSSSGTSVQTIYNVITTMEMQKMDIEATGGQYCFLYRYMYFPAARGEQLSTTIESNSSIDFYLLTKADYDSWNDSSCHLSFSSPLVNQTGITRYVLSVTIPSDGTYYYVFINRSPDKAASVTYGFPWVMTASSVVTLSSSVASSYVTTTSSAVSPSATSPNIQGLGEDNTPVLAAVVAAVAFVLAYIVGMRRARRTPPPPPE
jgi:hypothetical protein